MLPDIVCFVYLFRSSDDSVLTVDPTPERNATLKAGLEALLRARENEKVSKGTVKKKSSTIVGFHYVVNRDGGQPHCVDVYAVVE